MATSKKKKKDMQIFILFMDTVTVLQEKQHMNTDEGWKMFNNVHRQLMETEKS